MKTKSPVPIFLASNEAPPPFLFHDKDDYVNSSLEARVKIDMINNWKSVKFAFIEAKKEFVPLLAEEAHNKIEDFKYIIRHT